MLTGGVFKPTKNDHFQEFLIVWVIFLKIWTGERAVYIRIVWNDKSATCIFMPLNFNLVCDQDRQSGVLNPTQNDQF